MTGQAKAALLRAFFAALDARRAPWCVVGDSRALPDHAEHDVDLVVDPGALGAMPSFIAEFAEANGARVVQDLQHEVDARFFVLAWLDPAGPAFLYLDVCADWRRRGRLLLRADDLLARREERAYAGGRFWRPAPADNFAYYLLKRVDKGALDAEQCGALALDYAADPDGCEAFLARRLPGHAAAIAAAARIGDWADVRALLPVLGRDARAAALAGTPRLAELARRALRFARPSGLLLHLATRVDDAARALSARAQAAWAPAFRRVAHLERDHALDTFGFVAAVRPLLVRSSLVTLAAPELGAPVARLPDVVSAVDADDAARDRAVLGALARRQAARRDLGFLRWGI